ncbi:RNA recognition motif domain - like 10 [Theobroma cacao]|nr:RNA recognition motif domain - like 10 [Theobroma cacao]
MEGFLSLPTSQCSTSSLFTSRPHSSSATTSVSFSLQPPPQPPEPNHRRPKSIKSSPKPKVPSNPLKNLTTTISTTTTTTSNNPSHVPAPIESEHTTHPLASKLRLSSKFFPPPPPPPSVLQDTQNETLISEPEAPSPQPQNPEKFRQDGKIFIGNLPNWIRKHEVAEFFRQFGPIKDVILIKAHNEIHRNAGFGFVIYGAPPPLAEKSAMKAVEFDGVEFHGRILTVKLDDGKRLMEKAEERARWVEGYQVQDCNNKSKWHQEREGSRKLFRKILESEPENWQKVVTAFERITKPARREFGLMVNYYARRGDMHRARETFERMRARGIEPTSHVYTNLIHAYAVGRDMEEALSCVRKMKEEGIEMTLVTYSILVGGFAKIGNSEKMDEREGDCQSGRKRERGGKQSCRSLVQGGKRETYTSKCNHLWEYYLCSLSNMHYGAS